MIFQHTNYDNDYNGIMAVTKQSAKCELPVLYMTCQMYIFNDLLSSSDFTNALVPHDTTTDLFKQMMAKDELK